jgi:hypothetical protein
MNVVSQTAGGIPRRAAREGEERMTKERKKLLITGCGRSGTLYASEVWRSLGLDILHERRAAPDGPIGRDGAASWFMAADDPNPPFGPSPLGCEFDFVLHLVRDPLKVIASVAQYILGTGVASPGFIERNAPETRLVAEEHLLERKEQLILRAARYWYHWNLLAETKADETIQVEQLASSLPRLCDLLGVEYDPASAEKVSKGTNARRYCVEEEPWVLTWWHIEALDPTLCEKILRLAAGYGLLR